MHVVLLSLHYNNFLFCEAYEDKPVFLVTWILTYSH